MEKEKHGFSKVQLKHEKSNLDRIGRPASALGQDAYLVQAPSPRDIHLPVSTSPSFPADTLLGFPATCMVLVHLPIFYSIQPLSNVLILFALIPARVQSCLAVVRIITAVAATSRNLLALNI